MKANEFRLGNLIYYHIEDSMDERKEWDEISSIDYDDIRCFVQYEDNSEYKPIPLTEEWLLKFGFEQMDLHRFNHEISILNTDRGMYFQTIRIDYVHQLQNLYFALTGNELELKP